MRRPVAAIIAAGLCSAALVGCTNDAQQPTDPSTNPPASSATTTPPTTSSARTTEQTTPPAAPKMPALAKEKSKAGAKAFVRYYIRQINHSWVAGKTGALAALGSSSCAACAAAVRGIELVIAKGGYKTGAEWTVESIVTIPLQSQAAPILNVAVLVQEGQFRQSSKSPLRRIDENVQRFDFHLSWRNANWQIEKLVAS